MGVAESLCLGTGGGGDPGCSYPIVDLVPLRLGFLSSQALSMETGKVRFVPGPVITGISD